MRKRVKCFNCVSEYVDIYPGWTEREAREWFEDDLALMNWAKVDGQWYCGECSRAAKLAAEWQPRSNVGTAG